MPGSSRAACKTRRTVRLSTYSRRPTTAASGGGSSSSAGDTQSDCLLDARVALDREKFSPGVTRLALKCVTKGAEDVYDTRWKVFSKWCAQQKPPIMLEVISAQDLHVADFLLHLYQEQHRALSTITSYRTAIASVLWPHHNRGTEHRVITQMKQTIKGEVIYVALIHSSPRFGSVVSDIV